EPGGLILLNASLVSQVPARQDVEVIAVPATRIADELGSTLLANMVLLGAYLAHTDVLGLEAAHQAPARSVKRTDLLTSDLTPLESGAAWLRSLGCARMHMCGPDGVP